MADRHSADRGARRESAASDPVLHARPLELAAISLRSVDGPRMESDVAARTCQPGDDRGPHGILHEGKCLAAGGGELDRDDRRLDRRWPCGAAFDRHQPAERNRPMGLGDGIAMIANDPNIRWIEDPPLGLAGRMYLPLFAQGLTTTIKHLFGPKVTQSFPDERPKIGNPLIYRGV